MSQGIDTHLVNGFKAGIDLGLQQHMSLLRGAVRVESQREEYDYYDRIGPTTAVELTTRHADTPQIDQDHDRRRVGLRHFVWADLIDNKDKLQMLNDPASAYVQNAVAAMNRKIDDVIIASAFGTAYTGKSGATSVTFPAGSEIAVDYHETAAADSNLTIGKLRRARFLFDSAEAGKGQLYAVVGPSQIQALLRTTEVTSADYNSIKALVHGEVDTFMGFKFIVSNRLTSGTGNVRECIFFERQGLLLAMAQDIDVRITERPDKNYSTQVFVQGSFGATRMWEEKVLRVKCDEDL